MTTHSNSIQKILITLGLIYSKLILITIIHSNWIQLPVNQDQVLHPKLVWNERSHYQHQISTEENTMLFQVVHTFQLHPVFLAAD